MESTMAAFTKNAAMVFAFYGVTSNKERKQKKRKLGQIFWIVNFTI